MSFIFERDVAGVQVRSVPEHIPHFPRAFGTEAEE